MTWPECYWNTDRSPGIIMGNGAPAHLSPFGDRFNRLAVAGRGGPIPKAARSPGASTPKSVDPGRGETFEISLSSFRRPRASPPRWRRHANFITY